MEALGSSDRGTLIGEVRQHFIRHPEDWSVEELFDQIGAFTSSDYRFALFIESLASSEIRPEEGSQRGFVAAVNEGLKGSGIELREVGLEGGFPIFKFESTTRVIGRPKTVIFASLKKPDIRFTDLINSDIEALDEAGDVLAFDRSIPEKGLLWRDLQTWWSEKKGLSDSEAKKDLYNRLFRSLPSNSPTQRLIFDTYYRTFAPKVHQLPVLLPEVWLNWDPLSLRERGENALAFQRVDFLMFFSPATRVIIEADGRQHYANENGSVNPEAYAKLARMNREVRLAGYEIFRFGNAELHDSKIGRAIVADFFQRLFKRHHLVE